MPAGWAQAILPSIPTLERLITAETGGWTRIRAVFRGSAMVACTVDFPIHDDPQR